MNISTFIDTLQKDPWLLLGLMVLLFTALLVVGYMAKTGALKIELKYSRST